MGFVVYNTASGRAERYYKKEGIAKAQATKLNRCPYRSKYDAGEFRAIAYRDYEGVLMGVRGDALKYWSWLNTANRG
jgi:hypothetical protein